MASSDPPPQAATGTAPWASCSSVPPPCRAAGASRGPLAWEPADPGVGWQGWGIRLRWRLAVCPWVSDVTPLPRFPCLPRGSDHFLPTQWAQCYSRFFTCVPKTPRGDRRNPSGDWRVLAGEVCELRVGTQGSRGRGICEGAKVRPPASRVGNKQTKMLMLKNMVCCSSEIQFDILYFTWQPQAVGPQTLWQNPGRTPEGLATGRFTRGDPLPVLSPALGEADGRVVMRKGFFISLTRH